MTFPRSLFIVLMALLTLEAAAAPKRQGFDGYPMIGGRNIFNPDRQMDVASLAPVPSVAASAPVTQSDTAALTGTMLTGKKALAFFSGSRAEWGGVFNVGSSIAGARIKKITSNGIEVEREGKTIAVAVGQCVPLDAHSVPVAAPVFAPAPPSASSAPAPAQASSVPAANSTAPAPADREALIRRMMEKRQQELK